MRKILAALLLAALSFTASAEVWQARYGVAETFNFKLFNADGTLDVDEADGGTEVSLSCNEGAETTATNDFVDEGNFYSIALTAAELQCERVAVVIAATTTEAFFIQTIDNTSAMTPMIVQTGDSFVRIGAAGAGLTAIDLPNQTMDITGTLSTVTSVTNIVTANATQVSGDSAAADALEAAFDGTAQGARLFGIERVFTAASATSTTLVMDSGAAIADDAAIGMTIVACGSTQGYCQSQPVTDNTVADDTLTVSGWTVTPSGTITAYLFMTAPASGGAGDATEAKQDTILANLATVDTNVDAILVDTGTTLQAEIDGVQADTENLQTRVPAALVSGRMDASVGAYASGLTPLQPTVAGRTFDVSPTGGGGVDWANVEAPTTTVGLSGTTIATSQAIASVSGAVGSVTGNVGGNVIGFVGSVNTNGISAASIAPDAGTELATAAWAATTRELTSGLNIVLAKGTGVTGFNDLSAVQVNAEVDTALSDIYLNQLLAVAYDPASPPGAADSLLEDLIENASGTARFTTGALVNAPAGGGGGSSDWSVGEREQIRHRIGIDGDATAPSATPSLASAASIAALNDPSIAEIRDMIIEDMGGGVSQGCAQAVLLTFAAGDISTSGGTTTWRDPSNGEVRIVSTVTSSGNRTSTITCPTY